MAACMLKLTSRVSQGILVYLFRDNFYNHINPINSINSINPINPTNSTNSIT